MGKQLQFDFDTNEVNEFENDNSLYKWCIANDRKDLLEEWDYDKNDINPSEISSRNDKKVWWKCSNNHSWCAAIGQRVRTGSGCPECYRLSRIKKK